MSTTKDPSHKRQLEELRNALQRMDAQAGHAQTPSKSVPNSSTGFMTANAKPRDLLTGLDKREALDLAFRAREILDRCGGNSSEEFIAAAIADASSGLTMDRRVLLARYTAALRMQEVVKGITRSKPERTRE